ncbi:hypothetical protein BH18ACT5_BH18ACT5_13450 [soil metagenome]
MEGQASEQVWLDRPWGRLSVWRSGSGPTVCAIHGLGGSGRYWGGLARLAPSRTLLAPDLPGFGQSDKPALRYDRQFHLAEIENLIDAVGSNESVVMIGHSAGAVLAAMWVARHPERAGGLAIVSAPFPHPSLMPDIAKRVADRPPADRGTVAPIVARVLWPILSRIAVASRRFPADVVSDFGRQSLGARADTMWSLLADVSVIEEMRPLAGLPVSIPVLLLAAADDRYVGQHALSRWRQLLPNAETVEVPTGGHQFLLREGFEALVDWLNSIPTRNPFP